MGHLIVCSAQLEAEDWLQVLALEQHIAFQAVAQVGCVRERRLVNDLVDARGEDETEILPWVSALPDYTVRRVITSGCPLGRRNAFGTMACLGESDAGLGFAVYSVNARPVGLGVRGDATPLGPLAPLSGVVGRE